MINKDTVNELFNQISDNVGVRIDTDAAYPIIFSAYIRYRLRWYYLEAYDIDKASAYETAGDELMAKFAELVGEYIARYVRNWALHRAMSDNADYRYAAEEA